jgi:predicted HNH restriction endonuclease
MTTKEIIAQAQIRFPHLTYWGIAQQLKMNDKTVKYHMDQTFRNRRKQRIGERRQEIKQTLLASFGRKCSRCGYSECPSALEFHHLDPTKKDIKMHSANGMSLARYLQEAQKCVLLCANCHRLVHEKAREEN